MDRELTSRLPPEDLVDLIYRAAVDPPHWNAFALALSDRCGGAAVSIVLHIAGPGDTSYAFAHGFDASFAGVLNRFVPSGIPWMPKPGEETDFFFGSDYFPDERLPATEFFKQVMQPQGFAPEGPIVCALNHTGGMPDAVVVLHRREGCRRFCADDLALCKSLTSHLKRAYRIHQQLHGEGERRRAQAQVVDRFPTGVILLDAQQHCVVVNKSAERILEQCDGLTIVRERPSAHTPHENDALREAVIGAMRDAGIPVPGAARLVSISRPSGRAPFTVMALPLMDAPRSTREAAAVVALFVTDPESVELETSALQQLYRFTPAEAELVTQLLGGCSLEQASEVRGIAISTARGHLKAAFQKTATRSQRDLIRLVLTGVGPMGQS